MDLNNLSLPPELLNLALSFALRSLGAAVLLLIAAFIARKLSALVGAAATKAKLDPTLGKFASKLIRWGVMVVAIVMSLGTFGIKTTSFAAILGAAGLAVGLALQGTLSHFAAGVMLLIFRPFKVGDTVEVGGRRGKVDEIDLLFTVLDTPDNRRFILPNGQVFGAAIENVTHHPLRRADVFVSTAYSANLAETRRVLNEAALTIEKRSAEKEPQIVLANLGASGIDWEVRVWTGRDDLLEVLQATREAVKVALDESGIAIPFPQMDVHIDGTIARG